MIWPLTGRTGTGSGTPAACEDQAPAASTTRGAGTRSPVSSSTPLTPVAVRGEGADPCAAPDLTAGPLHAVASAATSLRGSAEWSPGTSSARRTVGGQGRLGAAGLAGAQALDREPERAPEREQPLEHLGVVAVARHDQRAAGAEARVLAAGLCQLRAERLEARGGADPRPVSACSPKSDSATGASIPAATLPGARLAGVEHARPQAAFGGLPRARHADGASADDRDVDGFGWNRTADASSLRRHYPDQVRRSAATCRPLSPNSELP
jgi:hypothetical protein